MGEEFYAIIKLVSGEEIFSLICLDENDGDPVIVLQNPVIMKLSHTAQGSYLKVKSWIEMSNENFFIVKLNKIITMTESKDDTLINVYNNYISNSFEDDAIDVYNPSGKVKPSSKMGYISSVEDARKKLENLFKDLKEG
jgi:hypothetical protein